MTDGTAMFMIAGYCGVVTIKPYGYNLKKSRVLHDLPALRSNRIYTAGRLTICEIRGIFCA